MAPELFGGVETQVLVLVSKASDVWAFGCLCLEVWFNIHAITHYPLTFSQILSGTHPWASARTDAAVMLGELLYSYRFEPI